MHLPILGWITPAFSSLLNRAMENGFIHLGDNNLINPLYFNGYPIPKLQTIITSRNNKHMLVIGLSSEVVASLHPQYAGSLAELVGYFMFHLQVDQLPMWFTPTLPPLHILNAATASDVEHSHPDSHWERSSRCSAELMSEPEDEDTEIELFPQDHIRLTSSVECKMQEYERGGKDEMGYERSNVIRVAEITATWTSGLQS